jgi:hypothetical protein
MGLNNNLITNSTYTKFLGVTMDNIVSWNNWDGTASWYSDSPQVGQSGDQILVGMRFSTPVQTGPGAHPAS